MFLKNFHQILFHDNHKNETNKFNNMKNCKVSITASVEILIFTNSVSFYYSCVRAFIWLICLSPLLFIYYLLSVCLLFHIAGFGIHDFMVAFIFHLSVYSFSYLCQLKCLISYWVLNLPCLYINLLFFALGKKNNKSVSVRLYWQLPSPSTCTC